MLVSTEMGHPKALKRMDCKPRVFAIVGKSAGKLRPQPLPCPHPVLASRINATFDCRHLCCIRFMICGSRITPCPPDAHVALLVEARRVATVG
jgi:hypothetical protein